MRSLIPVYLPYHLFLMHQLYSQCHFQDVSSDTGYVHNISVKAQPLSVLSDLPVHSHMEVHRLLQSLQVVCSGQELQPSY